MARSDERRAAYFALLRAREELASLRRYQEYLVAERERLDRFAAGGADLEADVDPRLRRAVRHTDGPLSEALELRRRVLADERRRLPERIDAAQVYADELEAAYTTSPG